MAITEEDIQTKAQDRHRETMQARYINNWVQIFRLLGRCCQHCGGKFVPCQYALHHPDPRRKESGWDTKGWTWKHLYRELIKQGAILLCHNCHAKLHANPELQKEELYAENSALSSRAPSERGQ